MLEAELDEYIGYSISFSTIKLVVKLIEYPKNSYIVNILQYLI